MGGTRQCGIRKAYERLAYYLVIVVVGAAPTIFCIIYVFPNEMAVAVAEARSSCAYVYV